MANNDLDASAAQLEPDLHELKLEGALDGDSEGPVKAERAAPMPLSAIPPRMKTSQSRSQSPTYKKQESESPSPSSSLHEETLGGDITLMAEPGKAPKLSRAASRTITRAPPLYLDLPDSTAIAKETFVVLPECTYANKHIGTTDPALECDCGEEWDAVDKINNACGEDSDCINRATKMECVVPNAKTNASSESSMQTSQ
jgi:hypothetical protein